jgi:hypothetical protein
MSSILLQHYFATHKNLGDILYYFLVKNLFCDDLNITHDRVCSINAKRLPFFNQIIATNIRDALNTSQANSHLMIGGGAIIRNNKLSSFRTTSQSFHRIERMLSNISTSKLTSTACESAYASLRLPPESIGPFLLKPQPNLPYGYVSAGFGGTMKQISAEDLNSVFSEARYVYVRDRIAFDYLHKNSVTNNLYYAPDLAVLTDAVFTKDFLEPHFFSFKAKTNLVKKNYVLIQSNSNRASCLQVDCYAVTNIATNLDAQVIPLAMADVHGDSEYAQQVSTMLGSKYSSDLTFFERLAAIAYANFFIGTSMHGCLLSFVYGVRFLPLDSSSIKLSRLIATLSENHPQCNNIVDSFSFQSDIAYRKARYDDLFQCKQQAVDDVSELIVKIKNIITV